MEVLTAVLLMRGFLYCSPCSIVCIVCCVWYRCCVLQIVLLFCLLTSQQVYDILRFVESSTSVCVELVAGMIELGS